MEILILMVLLTIAGIGLGIAYIASRVMNKNKPVEANAVPPTNDTLEPKYKRRRIIALVIIAVLFIGGWVLAIAQIDGQSSGGGSGGGDVKTVSEYYLYSNAKTAVKARLKNPSTAEFETSPDIYILKDNQYRVEGYVDSQNDFGAMVRNNFSVVIKYEYGKYSVISCRVT